MPNPRVKPQPLPDFDRYAVDFDSANRPCCFHLFWNDVEVATIRLEYDASGFLNKAIREGTRKQRFVSMKELANIPFFTTYIHRINLIDLITEIDTIGKITSIENAQISLNPIRNSTFANDFAGWYLMFTNTATRTYDVPIGYAAKFNGANGDMRQYLNADTNRYNKLIFLARREVVGGDDVTYIVGYTDGTQTSATVATGAFGLYASYAVVFDANKTVEYVSFTNFAAGICYVARPMLVETNNAIVTGSLTQSTKHDAKTYIYAFGDIAATGLLGLAKAASKVIKLHFYSLQSTVDGVTAYFYEETSTTQLSKKWILNAREGQESPFVTAPANLAKCATQNKDVGINISGGASPHVYWEMIYSVDDAS